MSDEKICPLAILHDSKDVMNCLKEDCMAWKTEVDKGYSYVDKKGYCIILKALEKLANKGG